MDILDFDFSAINTKRVKEVEHNFTADSADIFVVDDFSIDKRKTIFFFKEMLRISLFLLSVQPILRKIIRYLSSVHVHETEKKTVLESHGSGLWNGNENGIL